MSLFRRIGRKATPKVEAPLTQEPKPKKRRGRSDRANYDWLRADEVDDLLTAAESTRDRAILATFFYLGCRSNELRMLNVEDVDFKDGVVRILHAKGGKQRVLPLDSDTLEPALRAWLAIRPERRDAHGRALFPTKTSPRISNRYLRTLVKYYGDKAGVGERIPQRLHPHSMRHTAATLMLHNGVDIKTVSDYLGHSDIAITSVYLGTDTSKKRTAQSVLGAALKRAKEAAE